MAENNKRKQPESESEDLKNLEEKLLPKRTEEDVVKCKALMVAAEQGKTDEVLSLLSNGADIWYRDEAGRGPLHLAAAKGHLETVKELLLAGHPWNELDGEGRCAGQYAEEEGEEEVYEFLIEEGVRVELLFNLLERREEDEEDDEEDEEEEENKEKSSEESKEEKKEESEEPKKPKKEKKKEAVNQDYLDQKLHYSDDKLLDSEDNAVMMNWEGPLMEKHAELMCRREGLDVINVGFGLGLIDDELQKYKPRTHTIIEAHPDVYARMIELGWDKKPGVKILFGRWQDVTDQLTEYDAIFFDTFGEFWQDLRQFCQLVPDILKPDGIYSFFNGLGGSNPFFHTVYCRIAEMELLEMGMETTYVKIEMEKPTEQVWDGVKRKYFTLTSYNLPICKLIDEV